MSLNGKRVLLIGGTSGIGFATATAAAERGAFVAVASSSQDRVTTALKRLPDTAEGHVLDVTDETAIAEFFEHFGDYDHLVYTAGDSLRLGSFAESTPEKAKAFFETRFWGSYAVAFHGAERIRPGGSIVLSSGSAGVRPRKGMTIAAAVTSAAEAMARALAVELAPIRVNVVRPGPTRTEMWHHSVADPEVVYANFADHLLVGRVGEAEEVARAYVFLMEQTFATGSVLTVDGGHFLG
ncbi:SDR family oxidoreductase [Actinosynnema sp. NPDC053489]|uniref:SDR family oxidoreductase n=1 Tax=Actinosynnema sp. NPDC053489 TaxID=3363916 RepID=UPI0037CA3C98